jgi:hypothetical protein
MKTFALQSLLLAVAVDCAFAVATKPAAAQTPSNQVQPAAQTAADSPTAAASAPPQVSSDARYAEILGQLTRVHLQRIEQLNAQVPGTITADDVALIQLQLKAADQLEQQAKSAQQIDWFSMVLTQAQIAKIAADLEWSRVSKVRQQNPQSIAELDAEMVHLRAELADVDFQRGQAVANKPADDRQNWALQYLVMQVQALQDKVRRLEERE